MINMMQNKMKLKPYKISKINGLNVHMNNLLKLIKDKWRGIN